MQFAIYLAALVACVASAVEHFYNNFKCYIITLKYYVFLQRHGPPPPNRPPPPVSTPNGAPSGPMKMPINVPRLVHIFNTNFCLIYIFNILIYAA